MEQTPLQMVGYRVQHIKCCDSCKYSMPFEDSYLCYLVDDWIDPLGICEKYEEG